MLTLSPQKNKTFSNCKKPALRFNCLLFKLKLPHFYAYMIKILWEDPVHLLVRVSLSLHFLSPLYIARSPNATCVVPCGYLLSLNNHEINIVAGAIRRS